MSKKSNRNKILVLGSSIYARPFHNLGECVLLSPNVTNAGEPEWNDIKLVVFTGGSDVSPDLYGHKKHKLTINNEERDLREKSFFTMCKLLRIPMVGICRGSQFLTVMNGGEIVQHVYSHSIVGTHSITTSAGKVLNVTSTHHQMMKPCGKFELLAWANGLSHQYETGQGIARPKRSKKKKVKEPEVVWYPETNSLAVQYHPEYMGDDTEGYKYFQELIKEKF